MSPVKRLGNVAAVFENLVSLKQVKIRRRQKSVGIKAVGWQEEHRKLLLRVQAMKDNVSVMSDKGMSQINKVNC